MKTAILLLLTVALVACDKKCKSEWELKTDRVVTIPISKEAQEALNNLSTFMNELSLNKNCGGVYYGDAIRMYSLYFTITPEEQNLYIYELSQGCPNNSSYWINYKIPLSSLVADNITTVILDEEPYKNFPLYQLEIVSKFNAKNFLISTEEWERTKDDKQKSLSCDPNGKTNKITLYFKTRQGINLFYKNIIQLAKSIPQ